MSASCSSCDEPSLGPLADHLPLELCQSAEDVEDQFSTAGRGVDLLGQALETDAPLLQPSDRLYKVWERSPETIELPHDEVAITLVYRYQPRRGAPIDAGELVADNGETNGYRY